MTQSTPSQDDYEGMELDELLDEARSAGIANADSLDEDSLREQLRQRDAESDQQT